MLCASVHVSMHVSTGACAAEKGLEGQGAMHGPAWVLRAQLTLTLAEHVPHTCFQIDGSSLTKLWPKRLCYHQATVMALTTHNLPACLRGNSLEPCDVPGPLCLHAALLFPHCGGPSLGCAISLHVRKRDRKHPLSLSSPQGDHGRLFPPRPEYPLHKSHLRLMNQDSEDSGCFSSPFIFNLL